MQKVTLIPRDLPYMVNEQIKYLRTNIQFSGADKQIILITSSQLGEGKSTTVLELALSMAELGKKVLLVDADLRRSMLKRQVANPRSIVHGLTHYLSGLVSLTEAICNTNDVNLDIVFAGPVPPNPSELLSADRMEPFLKWARANYDYILVDSAPLTAVIDAAVIAPQCDGAVFLIESERIPYKVAQGVVQQLESTGCPILGVVLNKVNCTANSRGYSRYYNKYGYQYTKKEKGKYSKK